VRPLPRQDSFRTDGNRWIRIHDAVDPVTRWGAESSAVDAHIQWKETRPGVEGAQVIVGGGASTWQATVALTRIDPAQIRFSLRRHTRQGGTLGAWSIDSIPDSAVLALNAGQYEGGLPWGWLVQDGLERREPGFGPLSMAVVFDSSGAVRLIPWKDIPRHRFQRDVVYAFQTYPTLLEEDARVPEQLQAPGRGVDIDHRDIRLALGQLSSGHVIIALTRFADVTGVSLPFGPTVPEMAALMGALGAQQAVLLDGGLSAQLALRDSTGALTRWAAPRRVPLAIEAWVRSKEEQNF
jgi:exopolysaccharide biosynthesis protein